MTRYIVSLRGMRRVEGTVIIMATSPEQAAQLATERVDDVVAEHLGWEVDYEYPVSDVAVTGVDEDES